MKKLFVHIPKTSGTSIKSVIKDTWNRSCPFGHDPFFELQKMNKIDDDVFSFTVVRNPFTRTYSYYHHYKKINNSQITFYDFLNLIRKKQATNKTPMIIYDQSFYVYDIEGNCTLKKIYRFENLVELENDLGIKIPKMNVGNYDNEQMEKDYNKTNISLVKHLFLRDFINFNY